MKVSAIQALIEKAKASAKVARGLFEEGEYDFAAPRAYYAMFYVAEALLAHLGQSYSQHSAVLSTFGREYVKTGKLDPKFHRWLIDAQDFRNIGDYSVEDHVSMDQAEAACNWAEEFIAAAEAYLSRAKGDRQ